MSVGIRELVLLITATVIAWPYCRVLSRLGFSPWLGPLVFVPIVNIIALWLFAYAKWPALREPSLQPSDRTLTRRLARAGAAADRGRRAPSGAI